MQHDREFVMDGWNMRSLANDILAILNTVLYGRGYSINKSKQSFGNEDIEEYRKVTFVGILGRHV